MTEWKEKERGSDYAIWEHVCGTEITVLWGRLICPKCQAKEWADYKARERERNER
jgi:hypothetical protein